FYPGPAGTPASDNPTRVVISGLWSPVDSTGVLPPDLHALSHPKGVFLLTSNFQPRTFSFPGCPGRKHLTKCEFHAPAPQACPGSIRRVPPPTLVSRISAIFNSFLFTFLRTVLQRTIP